MGDEIQAIKAGLLEVADIVVVNKGDRPGAQRTASQLRAMLVAVARVGAADRGHHGATGEIAATDPAAVAGTTASAATPEDRPRPKQPEVLITTATTGEGIPELLASLDRHRAAGHAGFGSAARLARAEAQVWAILTDRIQADLAVPDRRAETVAILRAVADHDLDPFAAADRLLAILRG
jgi:LAO/AO transport system kinase